MRRKLRSLFALLQIAVAIAAFVSIVGVTQGLRGQFYRLGEVFAHDLVVQVDGAASPIFSAVTRDDAEQLLAIPEVQAVSLIRLHFMRAPNLAQPIGFLGLDPESEAMARHEIVRGRGLRKEDTKAILVGEVMAEDLGIDTSALVPGGIEGAAPTLTMESGLTFEVVGVFRSPLQDVPFLSGQGLVNLQWLLDVSKGQPHMAFLHLKPGSRLTDPDDVKAALRETARVAPKVKEALPRLAGKSMDQFLDSFKQAELIDKFALAVLFLAALVSGIGVANTMLMSVFDRTREIGLLRAVGWSRARIVTMIELEGVLLSLGGGILGAPLGWLLIKAASLLVQLGWLSVSIDPVLYLEAVAVATGIGLIGSAYPAVRAAYLEPTEALRYE